MAKQGILIISDITGYSKYVNESELEHARDSLTDLLNILIEHVRSPLVLSKLEGDAVFSYVLEGGFLQGQTLLDMIESTYAAYRRALDLMVINTSCTCNACRNLPNLDLKFLVHYGTFMIQRLGAYSELVGHDVNLVHRLAKNQIKEITGFQAYAAFTQAVMDALQLDEIARSMTPYRESFADVGEVQMFVQDMHGVWERLKTGLQIEVRTEEALVKFEYEFPLPPPLLWDYITKPEYRTILLGSDGQELRERANGRAAVGSVYYCAHGKNYSLHRILDWHPFEQYTTNDTHPLPGITANYTYKLQPAGEGTRLILLWGRASGHWLLRVLSDLVVRFIIARNNDRDAERFLQRIQQDLADGTAFVSPQVAIGKDQVSSLARQVLTPETQDPE